MELGKYLQLREQCIFCFKFTTTNTIKFKCSYGVKTSYVHSLLQPALHFIFKSPAICFKINLTQFSKFSCIRLGGKAKLKIHPKPINIFRLTLNHFVIMKLFLILYIHINIAIDMTMYFIQMVI